MVNREQIVKSQEARVMVRDVTIHDSGLRKKIAFISAICLQESKVNREQTAKSHESKVMITP